MKHKRDFKALEQRRLKAVKLLKQGVAQAAVARRLEVSRESVSHWAAEFEANGKEALKRKRLGRPAHLDERQRRELVQALVQGAMANGFPTELWTLQRVAKLIGRRYVLGLLSLVANRGTVRFSQLRSRLGDVSSSTLAARLADLEAAGLIARTVRPETPPRVDYSLTARGRELCRVLTDFLRRGRPPAG